MTNPNRSARNNRYRATAWTLLLGALALPAWASGAASSVSFEGLSVSVGGSSTSLQASSDSASGGAKKVAAGEYRVAEIIQAPGRPGDMRLRLEAVAAANDDGFFLILPQAALEQGGVGMGERVSARQHAYGVEFARAETRTPFYLVLDDDWHRGLRTRAVTL